MCLQIFQSGQEPIVRNIFEPYITALVLRIYPLTKVGGHAIRMELYTCTGGISGTLTILFFEL